MKTTVIYTTLLLLPILLVAQNNEKPGIIKMDKKGGIYSVKFPSAMENNKRPKYVSDFMEAYLQ